MNELRQEKWALACAGVVDRLVVSMSYSALRLGGILIQQNTSVMAGGQSFGMVVSLLCVMLSMRVQRVKGLHSALLMLGGQQFSASIPLPQEPSGTLLVPAVLLYFAAGAVIMQYLCRVTPSTSLAQESAGYFTFFMAARGLSRFQAMKQEAVLGILSMVCLLLPIPVQAEENSIYALGLWRQTVECLANRGVVIWLIARIEIFTGVSSLFPNLFFFLALAMWNPFAKMARMQDCTSVFSFYGAMEIVRIMQEKMRQIVCCSAMSCVLVCIIMLPGETSLVLRIWTMGMGVLATALLENWIRTWSETGDWMIVYLLVFVALESMGGRLQGQSKDATVIETGGKDAESKHDGTISHTQAHLGMPVVVDASGAH
jgi:hypothetical protein